MYKDEDTKVKILILVLAVIAYFLLNMLVGCTSIDKKIEIKPTPVSPIVSILPSPSPIPIIILPELSWENTTAPHPERKPWSKKLWTFIDKRFEHLDKAKDTIKFCPKYPSLSYEQKVQVWCELFVAISYYESGYDPRNESPDVGEQDDKNTWSVGLMQVSQVDIKNYNIKDMNYTYEDLLTVGPNLDLATALMANQIDKVGTILIGPGRNWLYWATLHPGGSYDESENIIRRVKKLSFCK